MRQGCLTLGLLLLMSLPASAQEPAAPAEDEGKSGPVGVSITTRFDTLLWWMRGSPLPFALASRNPTVQLVNTNGQVSLPGSLDQIGTESVTGDSLDYSLFVGGRLSVGLWFEDVDRFGMEASAFLIGPQSGTIQAIENGSPTAAVLARPFLAPLVDREAAIAIALPGTSAGRFVAESRLSNLWGIDSHAGLTLWRETYWQLDALLGGRAQQMNDQLDVLTTSVFPQGNAQIATPFDLTLADQVSTRARFYGVSMGLRSEHRFGWLMFQPSVKVALGVNQEEATLAGFTVLRTGGATTTTPTGFLVQPSNRGFYEQSEFSMIVEVGLNAGIRVSDNLRLTLGYSYLNWSNVPRPASMLDRNVSLVQQAPFPVLAAAGQAAGPLFQFTTTTFWAHGINVGAEFVF